MRKICDIVLAVFVCFCCGSCSCESVVEIPASDSRITYVGRTAVSGDDVSFNWTSTSVRISFTGKKLALTASDTGKNYFDFWVDASTGVQPTGTFSVSGDSCLVVLHESKKTGTHNVIIRKRTEGEQGTTTFHKVICEGDLIPSGGLASRQIEFIGDSYTCGYGAESLSASERFTPETENGNLSYAAVVARYFGADYVAIAHSGRGVARNYGDGADPTVAELYSRTFDYPGSEDFSEWVFSVGDFHPAVTVIMLGTNDFSCGTHPTLNDWLSAYWGLLKKIRTAYGEDHPIVCCAARGESLMHDYVRAAVHDCGLQGVTFVDFGDAIFPDSEYGADNHPTYAAHRRYAHALVPYISTVTGWELKNDICGGSCSQAEKLDDGDIVALHPRSEIEPQILAAKAVTISWTPRKVQKPLTLIQFSDLHGCKENLERIVEFRREYDDLIDDAIHVGDAVACYWDDENPWDDVKGAATIMNIVGNHDCWKGHLLWSQTPRPYDATITEAREKIITPYVSSWGVTIDPEATWFYKDYPESRIRLVALDCVHYTAEQNKWLRGTLQDARTKGLTVVGAVHYPSSTGVVGLKCGFTTPGFDISAEKNPSAVQIESMPEGAFERVDEFIAGGGKFVCWLSGHTHLDYLGHVAGHERQLQVIVDKAGYLDPYMLEDRTLGTVNQDAFNLVTVNPERGLLIVHRVGCNRDHEMRSKKLFCYDYLTHQLLHSE